MAFVEDESLQERQEEEVEVLKSIYDCDFDDLRSKDVWKVRRPPEILLKMKPNHDSRGNHQEACTLDLHVKCGDKYPLIVPKLKLTNAKGISDESLATLTSEIENMSQDLLGEVMILNIAQHVSSWLENLQKQKVSYSSFYEEMQEAQKAKVDNDSNESNERNSLQNDVMSKEEKEAILKEVAETQQALREEMKRQQPRKVSITEPQKASLTSSNFSRPLRKHSSSSMSFSDVKHDSSNWEGVKTLSFQMKNDKVKVERLSLIGNNVQGGSVFSGYLPEMGGKLVAISEWTFFPPRNEKASKKVAFCDSYTRDEKIFLKQISTIEQELTSMQKVISENPNHNVVQYLGISFDHPTLRVYEEFVLGSNFSSFLSENLPIELNQLRHYAASILQALAFMHEHNFVHRDLRDTSIYIESSGLIKVGDFSIDKRVRDLICQDPEGPGEDKFPLAIGRGGKKVDIYRFGILMLSFALGEIVHDPVSIPKGKFTTLLIIVLYSKTITV